MPQDAGFQEWIVKGGFLGKTKHAILLVTGTSKVDGDQVCSIGILFCARHNEGYKYNLTSSSSIMNITIITIVILLSLHTSAFLSLPLLKFHLGRFFSRKH
jgi:hypothetical protein